LPVEKYPYTDAAGKVLYYNCRFELPDGGKAFRQCDSTGLKWSVKDIKPKVPHRLPRVIEAETVFIVEGEKDCHSLAKLGLVGTCNVAGAGNWTPDLNQHFKDKEIILLPDNDDPGRDHMQKVCHRLDGVAGSIKYLKLPGLPASGDFTDWLEGFDDLDLAAERLAIMVENAGPFAPVKTAEAMVEIVSFRSISEAEVEDNPVITGLLSERESLILTGPSGVGKSLFMNHIALTLGNPPEKGLWGLFPIPRGIKTLMIQSENSLAAFNKRLKKLFAAHPELKQGAENVFTIKVGDDCRVAGSLTDEGFQRLLADSLASVGAGLLILDPLISYHSEDENDNAAMRRSLDCLTIICDQANVAVMLCHHYNRQNLTRGAASIRDWAANMLLMDFEDQTGGTTVLKITHDKARNYEQQSDFYLERTPDLNFLRVSKPGRQGEQVEAVVTALKALGGQIEGQAHLKNAVMIELNCQEATARRAINQALQSRKIIVMPGAGKGNPHIYKLPEQEY